MAKDIYSYVTEEETAYQTVPVPVIDGYEFSMPLHIKTTVLYTNGQLLTGKDDNKPVKNITLPILRLRHRSEGFDVKDVNLFVNDYKNFYKSFLVKKFHEKWALENSLDTFIDELIETDIDYGGVLVKNVNEVRPEVVPWQRIAFCDQTDILKGTIAEKHFYAPDELKEMASKGWGNTSKGATGTIDEVIKLAEHSKKEDANKKSAKTPGKYIEVYEVHGMFPKHWLDNDTYEETYDEDAPENEYVRQLHILTFYKGEDDLKHGICLYKGREKELPYKFHTLEAIYGRALGRGGVEELVEPQVWITYDIIRQKEMLDQAAKIFYQTTDEAFANRNKTNGIQNGEILVLADGKTFNQVDNFPRNISLFEKSIAEWEAHAQQTGAANDSIMGKNPTAGTPFKLQELVTAESHSLHEYRKGKLATFVGEIYRDWIIPYIVREITKGQEFLAELDLEELQSVADSLVTCEANKMIREKILNGEIVLDDEVETFRETVRSEFMKGNKKFIEILKDEMKDAPIDVKVSIVGKQKDLAGYTDKLVNIFRQILAAPQALDDPRLAKIFNQILESSGLDPIDFYSKPKQAPQQLAPPEMAQMPPNQISQMMLPTNR